MNEGNRNGWIAPAAIVAIGIVAVLLVGRILFADTSIKVPTIVVSGTPQSIADSTDGAVLKQTNERMLQMLQWTLGLVITVGGLLVGYSWFQNRSQRQEDEKRISKLSTGLKMDANARWVQFDQRVQQSTAAAHEISNSVDQLKERVFWIEYLHSMSNQGESTYLDWIIETVDLPDLLVIQCSDVVKKLGKREQAQNPFALAKQLLNADQKVRKLSGDLTIGLISASEIADFETSARYTAEQPFVPSELKYAIATWIELLRDLKSTKASR